MQIGTGCVPVGGTCAQDRATHSVIRLMRYLTGCGISPLHHRFTPKMESKGVSEMLWKCWSRKTCHHATPKSTWQGSTLWSKINKFWIQVDHGIMGWWFLLYHQKTIMQIGTGCVPVGGTCVQDCATHSVIRLMRYLTGCGISPLHHRFTPKMESKGVSEMLWKCRSRKKCHHATPKSTWQGSTLCKQNQ